VHAGPAGGFTLAFEGGVCCQVAIDAEAGTASGSFSLAQEGAPAAGIKRDIAAYAGGGGAACMYRPHVPVYAACCTHAACWWPALPLPPVSGPAGRVPVLLDADADADAAHARALLPALA
jgi:hypothetical protein